MDYQAGTILTFDKPLGWTSFQLVGKVRWLLCRHLGVKKLKVGHAGTLDPLASGLMILCTGKATKQIEQLQLGEKEYVATLQLGATTPSFDLEHAPEEPATDATALTEEQVREVLRRFEGEQEQVPPVFSACKVDGKRAYDLARKGADVELQAKHITISALELTAFEPTATHEYVARAAAPLPGRAAALSPEQNDDGSTPFSVTGPRITIRVACSKGTYIRSLARDIGEALGCGAFLTDLRRTRVGQYTIADACPSVEAFEFLLNHSK